MGVVVVTPVVNPSVRRLCRLSYPGHPKGCPNWGECDRCPPKAPMIDTVIDLTREVYAVYNVFSFGRHVEQMRVRHPDWSERQLRNCLYWQGTARKQLNEHIRTFLAWNKIHCPEKKLVVLTTPEACGVDVTQTMKDASIILEWPPENIAVQVAIVGEKLGT